VIDLLLWLLAAGWFAHTVGRLFDLRSIDALPPLPAGGLPGRPARVSVVIAARNEESRIERSVSKLLEQNNVELEIRIVDDRSTDRTPSILEELQQRDPRVRVIRVEQLPAGWLGKPHACHLGASRTTGDWLLFTDADAWIGPDVLARAVHAAKQEGADHLCLGPGQQGSTLAARAALIHFWMGMLWSAARANRDGRRSFIGVGAFNLVRAEAYHAIGGHEPLRLEVIDDLKLGALLGRAGCRSRFFEAMRDVEVHWAPTAAGVVRALEKNLFALFGFSVTLAAGAALALTVIHLATFLAPLTLRPAGVAAFLGMASTAIPVWGMARRAGWGTVAALLSPFMGLLLVAAIVHSTWITIRDGGVRWRDTFYPLDLLRRGLVRL
jgi:cellulose synthase/poly-beta-1,6-N-acetylglucosamine synthase-like glycosyltransferase